MPGASVSYVCGTLCSPRFIFYENYHTAIAAADTYTIYQGIFESFHLQKFRRYWKIFLEWLNHNEKLARSLLCFLNVLNLLTANILFKNAIMLIAAADSTLFKATIASWMNILSLSSYSVYIVTYHSPDQAVIASIGPVYIGRQ